MFVWNRKKPRLVATELAYIAMANKLLKKWRPGLTTGVLRRTHMNMCMIKDDWNPLAVDPFCGHAPATTKHYVESRKGRMIDIFRDQVAPKIDAEIDRVLASEPVRFGNLLQQTNAPAVSAGAQIVDLTDVG